MRKKMKQLLSFLLSFALVFGLMQGMSAAVYADDSVTIDFSTKGYSNEESFNDKTVTENGVSVTFYKDSGTNDPKYYNSGSAIRLYYNNTMTVSMTETDMISIEFAFGDGETYSNDINPSTGTYDSETKTWTGSAKEVTFTIGGSKGHRRLQKLTVSTESSDSTTYTVTYDANGGTGTMTDSTSYDSGATVTVLPNGFTAPNNKVFAGFKIGEGETIYANDSDSIADAVSTFTITEDTTLTAQWADSEVVKNVESISLGKTEQTIGVDGKASFTATFEPDEPDDKTVVWSVSGTNADAVKLYSDYACENELASEPTDILTVYAKGISAGAATINVTATNGTDDTTDDKTASCAITVEAPKTLVITADNFSDYFDENGNLKDAIAENSVLDFQGAFTFSGTKNINFNKKVVITSSTADAKFDSGASSGNNRLNFNIIQGADYTTVSKLEFLDCCLFIKGASNVTIDNITMVANTRGVGSGTGFVSAYTGASNTVIKNSYFENGGTGSANLVIGKGADHFVLENNTFRVTGSSGNIVSANQFVGSGATPENATFKNNTIEVETAPSAFCYCMTVMGSGNLVEGNTFNYGGSILLNQYGATSSGNIYRNNTLTGGGSFNPSANSTVEGNTLDCYVNVAACTTFTNNIVNIPSNNVMRVSGSPTDEEHTEISSNTITGNVSIASSKTSFKDNEVTGTINVDSNSKGNTITGNTVISTEEYAVILKCTAEDSNTTVTNNALIAAEKSGDDAVNPGTGQGNVISDNFSGIPLQDAWIQTIEDQTYTGQAIEPVVIVKRGDTTLASGTDYTVGYSNNTNVGTATVTITAVNGSLYGGSASATFTIVAVNSTVTTAPAAVNNLSYSGSAQALVTAGAASGGTVYYALGDNETTAPEFDGLSEITDKKWGTSIPKGTDTGTYYVWYMVKGDANHLDTTPACVKATISKAQAPAESTITEAQKPTAKAGIDAYYTGDAISLVNAPESSEGYSKILYKLENGEWGETIPTATDIGTYKVYVKYTFENYGDLELTDPIEVTIVAPDKTALNEIISDAEAFYNIIKDDPKYSGIKEPISNAINDAKAVAENEGATKTAVENALIAMNTKLAEALISVSTPSAPETSPVFTGSTIALVTAESFDGCTVKYVLGENDTTAPTEGWGTEIPTATDAGTYYVWYRMESFGISTEPTCITVAIAAVTDNSVTVAIEGWTYGKTAKTPVATAAFGAESAVFTYSSEETGTYTSEVPTMPGTYYVKATIAETSNYNGAVSDAVSFAIAKATQEAPTGLTGNKIKPDTLDGIITGVDDTMEYSVDEGSTWTHLSEGATAIVGLAPGVVYVRRAETATHKASNSVILTIEVYSLELYVYFADGEEDGASQYVIYNYENNRYEHVFTGASIRPSVIVEGGGEILKEGIDYTLSYVRSTNCSTNGKPAVVKITGKGDYTQTKSLEFTIVPAELTEDTIVAAGMIVKENQAIEPALYLGSYKLKTSDYSVVSSTGKMKFKTTDVNPSLTFTAKGNGNFTGSLVVPVTVIPKTEKKPEIKVTLQSGLTRRFNGEPQVLSITTKEEAGELTVKDSSNAVLTEGEDFVVSYSANINVGTVKVTVNGIGNYTGTSKKTFKILPDKNTSKVTAELTDGTEPYTYRKEGVTPAITVTSTRGSGADEISEILIEGTDYKVTYSNNKKVGSNASYKVSFLGNYKGREALRGSFTIKASGLEDAVINVGNISRVVNSDKKNAKLSYRSVPFVTIGNVKLTKGTDYTVSYWMGETKLKNDTITFKPGEISKDITVKIQGKGNYSGEIIEATYTVYKVVKNADVVNLSKAKIVGKGTNKAVTKQKYTGVEVEPEIDVLIKQNGSWVVLDEGLYDISYVNNIRRGTATIIVNGMEGTNTVGSKKANFTIVRSTLKDAISNFFGN
jgi:hypothetical protein